MINTRARSRARAHTDVRDLQQNDFCPQMDVVEFLWGMAGVRHPSGMCAFLAQSQRHCVRVVKEMDSKSIGLCPQGFESPWCRFTSGPALSGRISRLLSLQSASSLRSPEGERGDVTAIACGNDRAAKEVGDIAECTANRVTVGPSVIL